MNAEHWPQPFLPAPVPRQRPLPRPIAIAVVAALVIIGVIAGTATALGGPQSGRPQQPGVREAPPPR